MYTFLMEGGHWIIYHYLFIYFCVEQSEIALNPFDDKLCLLANSFDTLSQGHEKLKLFSQVIEYLMEEDWLDDLPEEVFCLSCLYKNFFRENSGKSVC